jgi:DNA-directed RNA polymerase subunit beta
MSFGRIPTVTSMPNLIEVQRISYEQFLQMNVPADERQDVGLQAVFKSVFPISDFSETASLEFVTYQFEPPKYDVEECQQRGMTYAAPFKVTLRLIVFEVDPDTEAKSVLDIKEQDVYMGDMPLMTDNGTFVVNGTERVIVSQMHRSPGVFFDHDKGKTHSSGKFLFAARVIPYRGSWLDFEFDAKDIVYVRIDRRRKLPVTTLLYALGMSGEEILDHFFRMVVYKRDKKGWRTKFNSERMRGVRVSHDVVNAKTGKVVVEAGSKVTPRTIKKLTSSGLKELLVQGEELVGSYVGLDIIDEKTGEILVEAGDELTEETVQQLEEQGIGELPILDVDNVTVGAYIRNTMAIDKNSAQESALIDIYRVMRPGEPPTVETACCGPRTSWRSSRHWSSSRTAVARLTTSTIWATDVCVPSAS